MDFSKILIVFKIFKGVTINNFLIENIIFKEFIKSYSKLLENF